MKNIESLNTYLNNPNSSNVFLNIFMNKDFIKILVKNIKNSSVFSTSLVGGSLETIGFYNNLVNILINYNKGNIKADSLEYYGIDILLKLMDEPDFTNNVNTDIENLNDKNLKKYMELLNHKIGLGYSMSLEGVFEFIRSIIYGESSLNHVDKEKSKIMSDVLNILVYDMDTFYVDKDKEGRIFLFDKEKEKYEDMGNIVSIIRLDNEYIAVISIPKIGYYMYSLNQKRQITTMYFNFIFPDVFKGRISGNDRVFSMGINETSLYKIDVFSGDILESRSFYSIDKSEKGNCNVYKIEGSEGYFIKVKVNKLSEWSFFCVQEFVFIAKSKVNNLHLLTKFNEFN